MNRYAVNSIWATKRRKIPQYLMAAASDCYHEKTSLIPFKLLQIQGEQENSWESKYSHVLLVCSDCLVLL